MPTDRLAPSPRTAALSLALGLLWTAPSVEAQSDCESSPETVGLTGLVRDFREHSVNGGHPDFETTIPTGSGLYCGNVDPYLHEGRPNFIGGGRKVYTQATDAQERKIAPHLANKRFASDAALQPQSTEVILQDSQGVDAFLITYVSAEFNTNGTSTWVYHVEELSTGKDLSHWLLVLDPSHQVTTGTTPGYSLGVDGSTGFYGIKWDVTDAFEEADFTIVLDEQYLGADLTCSVVAKGGNQADNGDLFAPTTTISTTGTPFSSSGGGLVNDASLGDTSPSLGVSSQGGIESPASFKSWYKDNPPLNMSTLLPITLTRQADCTYLFDSATDPAYSGLGGFFPIDGMLLGNSGGSPDHNFHFTYEIHATFTYDASADQFFRFKGDDDVWVFVDGKLAVDLGGIHGPMEQFVDMDRMGLEDGKTYTIDIFFAERHRTQSNFLVQANFLLDSIDPKMVSAIFD